MSEEQALDELDLLIQEYDPEQSDWRFRKSVMMQLINRIRPATLRSSAVSAQSSETLKLADKIASFAPRDGKPIVLIARERRLIEDALRRTEPQSAGRAPADQNCPIGSSDPSVCSAGCCIRCSDWRDGFNVARSQAGIAVQEVARQALVDAAQFMDGVKPDAVSEGWWLEWDGQTREKITAALTALTRPHREEDGN